MARLIQVIWLTVAPPLSYSRRVIPSEMAWIKQVMAHPGSGSDIPGGLFLARWLADTRSETGTLEEKQEHWRR